MMYQSSLIKCIHVHVCVLPCSYLRLRYSDQKGPDINGLYKEFLNNYSSYTFQL